MTEQHAAPETTVLFFLLFSRMVLEKSTAGKLLFSVTVSDQALTLRHGQNRLAVSFRTEGRLPLDSWTHLVLQVTNIEVSCYWTTNILLWKENCRRERKTGPLQLGCIICVSKCVHQFRVCTVGIVRLRSFTHSKVCWVFFSMRKGSF